MSKNSGPRSDLVFNNLALAFGGLALLGMVGFLIGMSIAVGIVGAVAKSVYVAFFVVFWVEIVFIVLSAYFVVTQWVRNINTKIVAALVLNACATAILVTFVVVMTLLGHGAQLLLIG